MPRVSGPGRYIAPTRQSQPQTRCVERRLTRSAPGPRVGRPAPARPLVPRVLAIFTLGVRRASSSRAQHSIASPWRTRTNRGLVKFLSAPTPIREIDTIPDLPPRFFGKSDAERPRGQFFSDCPKNHDGRPNLVPMASPGRRPVEVSTQRPEPLPPSTRLDPSRGPRCGASCRSFLTAGSTTS